MSDKHIEVSKVSSTLQRAHAAEAAAKQRAISFNIRAAAAETSLAEFCEPLFNPLALGKNFQRMEERLGKPPSEEPEVSSESEEAIPVNKSFETAERAAKSNPELSTRGLLTLLANIRPDMDLDDIIGEAHKFYPDPSNTDDALDFLITATENRKEVQDKITLAKEKFNIDFGREIKAGKNIAEQAREFSQKGLGSTSGLRDLYRDITGNPREPTALFEELSTNFEYEQMRTLIDFLLHSLGSDLRSKGPSIDLGELKRLLVETRSLQAILGVYDFFQARLSVIIKRFSSEGLEPPKNLSFILLAKLLIRYLKERYPSSDKVMQLTQLMGIQETVAKIIILTQYRDAMRHVAPRLFNSEKHRQDLLFTILQALSDLEDSLEESEEEDEEENEEGENA